MSQEKIERWNEVDGNLDNGEKLQAFLDSTTDAYAILQLRRTDETVYERFESYDCLLYTSASIRPPTKTRRTVGAAHVRPATWP